MVVPHTDDCVHQPLLLTVESFSDAERDSLWSQEHVGLDDVATGLAAWDLARSHPGVLHHRGWDSDGRGGIGRGGGQVKRFEKKTLKRAFIYR